MPGQQVTLTQALRSLADPDRRVSPHDLPTLPGLELPGLYAWFVDARGAEDLSRGLGGRIGPGLIYAGQTGAGTSAATLRNRVARNHARGNIRGSTFRLTLAAGLARPLRLEPIGFRRTTADGEQRLTEWIESHLAVSVHPYSVRFGLDTLETAVLTAFDPPLNLAKMPSTPIREALSMARRPFMRREL